MRASEFAVVSMPARIIVLYDKRARHNVEPFIQRAGDAVLGRGTYETCPMSSSSGSLSSSFASMFSRTTWR